MKAIRPILTLVLFFGVPMERAEAVGELVWPPAPDSARIAFVEEIRCSDLSPGGGFLTKVTRTIAGNAERALGKPFDLLVTGTRLLMTCQDLDALIEVDLEDQTYRAYRCKQLPMRCPVGICKVDDVAFVTDSGARCVYRYDKERLRPFIQEGLVRPTGIVFSSTSRLLYIIDTGDHSVKIHDLDGRRVGTIGGRAESDVGLNFPTFAVETSDGEILINDSLNYRIKRYDDRGVLISAFGEEGNGPGAFGRAKGIGTDSDGNIYVVEICSTTYRSSTRRGISCLS